MRILTGWYRDRFDDEMYSDFLETFPEFAEDKKDSVRKIDEEAMKSAKGKEAWRQFAAKYEGRGQSGLGVVAIIRAC